MGSLFRITMYSNDPGLAQMAADSSFQRVEVLNSIFSDYLPDSELQYLSDASGSGRYIPVSDELYDILWIAREISLQTDGAFDVTAGPFSHEWRAVTRGLRADIPGQDEINKLSRSVGFEYMSFHESDRAISLKVPDMQLDLGGIAKGYVAMEIWKVMQHFDILSVLIDAGGDILVGAPPPDRDHWLVALPGSESEDDSAPVSFQLSCKAITTSGDLYQYVEIDGVRYSHIVNPLTGWGITQPTSATVFGDDAILTDAYATALNIMPPEDGIALINKLDGYEAHIRIQTQEGPQLFYTDGFKDFVISE